MLSKKHARWLMICGLALSLVAVWLKPIDHFADRSVDQGLKRALAAFGAARLANAVLSTFEEVSVTGGVGVAEVSVKPGAVLDPIDDLVEQFSNLMLVVCVIFAVQKLMIALFGSAPICGLLTVLILAWLYCLWRERSPPTWICRFAVALLLLRIVVPVMAIASELSEGAIVDRQIQAYQQQVDPGQELDMTVPQEQGWWDTIKGAGSSLAAIPDRVAVLKAQANAFAERSVQLAAAFVVQTIVLPLFFLWLMRWAYRILRACIPSRKAGEST